MDLFSACLALTLPQSPCLVGPTASWRGVHASVGPLLDAGFPTFRAGVRGRAQVEHPVGASRVFAQADGAVAFAPSALGIPGPRLEASLALPVGFDVHGIGLSYAPIAYLDTQRTSQISGAIALTTRRGNARWVLRVENDYLAWRHRDEWRTAAIESHVYIDRDGLLLGFGFETKIWTATTTGLPSLSAGEIYDLSGQHGEGWSHGIACLAVTVQAARVCVGVDSEGIRDRVQNRFHDRIDDGQLAPLDRAPEPYIRLSFNPSSAAY